MRGKSRLGPKGNPPASLISSSIDSLTQGVSQQPSPLRQVGQGEMQVNAWSSPVNGLTKRRPAEFVGKVLSTQRIPLPGDDACYQRAVLRLPLAVR